jgi:gluconolactonase
MKTRLLPILLALALFSSSASTQNQAGHVVERLDPRLDAIISSDVTLELLAEHFAFIEGPLWVPGPGGGHLLFSDIPANVIYKWQPVGRKGELSIFLEPSGFTGKPEEEFNIGAQAKSGRVNVIHIGTNGLTLDREGRLVMAAVGDRAIVRIEKDGTRTMLIPGWQGKRFGGPNDFAAKSDGALYFTDTTGSLRGRERSPAREIPFTGLYLFKDGALTVLDKDPYGGQANGIALSPDEKVLYIGMCCGSNDKLLRYDIQADDTLANRTIVFEDVGSDGMKVDQRGNLYTTYGGQVWISTPDGVHLGRIRIPGMAGVSATNVAFGGADRRTLYITAKQHLYRIAVKIPGLGPGTVAH